MPLTPLRVPHWQSASARRECRWTWSAMPPRWATSRARCTRRGPWPRPSDPAESLVHVDVHVVAVLEDGHRVVGLTGHVAGVEVAPAVVGATCGPDHVVIDDGGDVETVRLGHQVVGHCPAPLALLLVDRPEEDIDRPTLVVRRSLHVATAHPIGGETSDRLVAERALRSEEHTSELQSLM